MVRCILFTNTNVSPQLANVRSLIYFSFLNDFNTIQNDFNTIQNDLNTAQNDLIRFKLAKYKNIHNISDSQRPELKLGAK